MLLLRSLSLYNFSGFRFKTLPTHKEKTEKTTFKNRQKLALNPSAKETPFIVLNSFMYEY